ncbi:MAG: type I restriction enzyme HsdR N-terminal domain-containing protein [Bacteroidetes bacterium]|nr:type I restriction enzyme HsdR N-terminal domain-containing protein [Bacteroidota bacterium]
MIFKNSTPWMIVECKSEQTEINENTLRQILAYHSHLQATYLTVTNGQSIHCFDIQNNCWRDSLPCLLKKGAYCPSKNRIMSPPLVVVIGNAFDTYGMLCLLS